MENGNRLNVPATNSQDCGCMAGDDAFADIV